MLLAKRHVVIFTVFLLCCGLKAGDRSNLERGQGSLLAHSAPVSVGKVFEVSPSA